MATNPTLRLVKDELYGFAKSKVMLVLWVILPAILLGIIVGILPGFSAVHRPRNNAYGRQNEQCLRV